MRTLLSRLLVAIFGPARPLRPARKIVLIQRTTDATFTVVGRRVRHGED